MFQSHQRISFFSTALHKMKGVQFNTRPPSVHTIRPATNQQRSNDAHALFAALHYMLGSSLATIVDDALAPFTDNPEVALLPVSRLLSKAASRTRLKKMVPKQHQFWKGIFLPFFKPRQHMQVHMVLAELYNTENAITRDTLGCAILCLAQQSFEYLCKACLEVPASFIQTRQTCRALRLLPALIGQPSMITRDLHTTKDMLATASRHAVLSHSSNRAVKLWFEGLLRKSFRPCRTL